TLMGEEVALAEGTDTTAHDGSAEDFGANAWLVDEMYKKYVADKNSVDPSWWPTLEKFKETSSGPAAPASAPAAQSATARAASGGNHAAPPAAPVTQP